MPTTRRKRKSKGTENIAFRQPSFCHHGILALTKSYQVYTVLHTPCCRRRVCPFLCRGSSRPPHRIFFWRLRMRRTLCMGRKRRASEERKQRAIKHTRGQHRQTCVSFASGWLLSSSHSTLRDIRSDGPGALTNMHHYCCCKTHVRRQRFLRAWWCIDYCCSCIFLTDLRILGAVLALPRPPRDLFFPCSGMAHDSRSSS